MIPYNICINGSFFGFNVRFVAFFRLFRLYQLLSLLKGKGGELITLAAIPGIGIIFGGVGVLLTEINDPSSNIKTLGEGVWWATATIIL